MMAGIKEKNTKPIIMVRSALSAEGFHYQLHLKDMQGASRYYFIKHKKVVIFLHGCFWYRYFKCRYARPPTTNADFWRIVEILKRMLIVTKRELIH